jgi:two-component system chemotaxis response regulator CheV
MAKQQENSTIILESGTNEVGIMEFTIAGLVFGINVSKLNKIMKFEKVIPMPNSHPCVEGIFKPRDKIITVIDLPQYMGLPPSETSERNYFIITNFNNMEVAFHVHTVEGIHRISWTSIEKPDATIYGGVEGMATGIAKVKDKLITIVDFEKIVFDITPQSGIQLEDINDLGPRERNSHPLMVAEDSNLLQRLILDALHQSGYTNVKTYNNGQETWDALQTVKKNVVGGISSIGEQVSLLVTDIEMPMMDGHRLTKLVKEDPILKQLPVVNFSSLISEEMYAKGLTLGADAQLSKPEIAKLVSTIDQWILK